MMNPVSRVRGKTRRWWTAHLVLPSPGPGPGAQPSTLAASAPSAHPDLRPSVGGAGLGRGPLPQGEGDVGLFPRCLPFPLSMSSRKLTPFLPSLDYVSLFLLSFLGGMFVWLPRVQPA